MEHICCSLLSAFLSTFLPKNSTHTRQIYMYRGGIKQLAFNQLIWTKCSCELIKILCVHASAVDVATQTGATGVSINTEIISQEPTVSRDATNETGDHVNL